MLLVYLDSYHLGDPLFLSRFARDVQAHTGPLLLVHGGGEEAERVLEAEGLLPEQVNGIVQVADARQALLVERAIRDLNRRIVHELNEVGVAALRLTGADRGLLRMDAEGILRVGKAGWLRTLMRQGAVPVLATLVEVGGGVLMEADPTSVCVELAHAMTTETEAVTVVVLIAGRATRLVVDGTERTAVRAEKITDTPMLPAGKMASRLAANTVRVRAAAPASLRGTGLPEGTVILP